MNVQWTEVANDLSRCAAVYSRMQTECSWSGQLSYLRRWLIERNIIPRIARRGVETSQRLGRHCWVVERPMVQGHQTRRDPYRGRYFKPRRLHADKAYDIPLRKWLWGKHIGVRIARKGIESMERLLISSECCRGG